MTEQELLDAIQVLDQDITEASTKEDPQREGVLMHRRLEQLRREYLLSPTPAVRDALIATTQRVLAEVFNSFPDAEGNYHLEPTTSPEASASFLRGNDLDV